jgi:hypothetical protein
MVTLKNKLFFIEKGGAGSGSYITVYLVFSVATTGAPLIRTVLNLNYYEKKK